MLAVSFRALLDDDFDGADVILHGELGEDLTALNWTHFALDESADLGADFGREQLELLLSLGIVVFADQTDVTAVLVYYLCKLLFVELFPEGGRSFFKVHVLDVFAGTLQLVAPIEELEKLGASQL